MGVDETEFETAVETGIEQNDGVPYVPGTVYFMKEIDFLDGQTFPYYKIGIVKNDKEVEVRKKQHRTGNPRDIVSVRDIVSPAAQKLETRLHNEFASHRIAGEWFNFSEDLLDTAISRALELNAQLVDEIDILNSAKKIKAPGTGAPLPNTAEYSEAAELLGSYLAEKDIVSKAKTELSKRIKALAEGNPRLERLLEARNNEEKNAFSVEILRKKYKDLYEEFKTKETHSIKPKWLVAVPEFESGEVLAKFGCPDIDAIGNDPIELHQAFLKIWTAGAELEWEIERIEARLLHEAKDAKGIMEVLEWKTTTSKAFDTKEFAKKHEAIYQDCFKKTESKISYRVVEWASYAL